MGSIIRVKPLHFCVQHAECWHRLLCRLTCTLDAFHCGGTQPLMRASTLYCSFHSCHLGQFQAWLIHTDTDSTVFGHHLLSWSDRHTQSDKSWLLFTKQLEATDVQSWCISFHRQVYLSLVIVFGMCVRNIITSLLNGGGGRYLDGLILCKPQASFTELLNLNSKCGVLWIRAASVRVLLSSFLGMACVTPQSWCFFTRLWKHVETICCCKQSHVHVHMYVSGHLHRPPQLFGSQVPFGQR